jgi:peptidylprolyl isomerase
MTRHNVFPAVVLATALGTAGCSNFCFGNSVGFGVESANAPGLPAPPDVAAAPSDAVRTPSGLASRVLTPGTGTQHPRPNSEVTVHYTGWTTDGKMFDSSVARGEPATFSLNGVIPGWTEGVQMMVVGEKRRFWIPAKLAYDGVPGSPQGTLVFDVELLKTN